MRPFTILFLLALLLTGCSNHSAKTYYEEACRLAEQGDAPQALSYFRKAADHVSQNTLFSSCGKEKDSLRAIIYTDMGRLLFEEGLQEQALDAYQKAYEACKALSDSSSMAYALFDIANMYRTREADDSCLYYFAQAQQLAQSQGDSLLMNDIQSQLAGYYLWHKDYQTARQLLLPALTAEDQPLSGVCFMAADLYRQTGPVDSARYYCLSLLEEEDIGLRQMAHKWLADILLSENRPAEAAKHLEQYELLTDSLMQEIDTESLHHISALYDYTLREQENDRLQRWMIIAVAAVALLMLLLLAIFFFAERRRMQYRMRLQQLELILEDYRKDKGKTAEANKQILSETDIVQQINRLLNDSQTEMMSDEDWHCLEDTIQTIQPQFLSRLHNFHHFSPHELHVCLLLRLNLSPAAIAQLTAHSKQSISSTRSRLFEKVFGQKGSPVQWDEFIQSL